MQNIMKNQGFSKIVIVEEMAIALSLLIKLKQNGSPPLKV